MPTPTFGYLNSPRGAVQAQNWDWDNALLDWVPSTGAPVVGVTGPISIADGADVAEGATTDAAVVTDTTGTVSGKLRGLVKWAFERMPVSLGQKAMAASFPVVIASDQSTLPISAASLPLPTGAATEATLATRLADATFTGRINTQGQKAMAASTPVVLSSDQSPVPIEFPDVISTGAITSTESVTIALNGAATLRFSITGTWTGTILFEQSLDGINYFSTPALPISQLSPSNSNAIVGSATANGRWVANGTSVVSFRLPGA